MTQVKIKPSWLLLINDVYIPIAPLLGQKLLKADLIEEVKDSKYPHIYTYKTKSL